MPGSEKYQRKAGGLDEIQIVGDRNYIHRRDGDQFTITAVDGIAERGEFGALILQSGGALGTVIAEVHWGQNDALTGSEAGNIFADGYDLACDVAAQNVRQLHARQPLAHPDIEMIHGASFDPD